MGVRDKIGSEIVPKTAKILKLPNRRGIGIDCVHMKSKMRAPKIKPDRMVAD